ncbi:MAG: hypothetical protein J6I98_01765, partial [Clostridia bacterium]|nr:hypothetical protein [Clostridia bacterium]
RYGLDIPGYSLYRLWKSYHQCVRGEELVWDEFPLRRLYTIRDTKLWRSIAWFAASTAFALVVSGAAAFPALPPNRGELTVAQFAANFNYLRDYYDPGPLGSEYNYTLAENGEWQAKTAAGDAYIYVSDIPNRRDPIPFVYYTDADGSLTGFSISNENGEYWELMDLSDFQFAALAMITAQPECGLFSNQAQTVSSRLGNLTDTDFTVAGVHITLEYEFTDETVSYHFTVTKEQ